MTTTTTTTTKTDSPSRSALPYTASDGRTYTSPDGQTYTSPDGQKYTSTDGVNILVGGKTYKLRRAANGPIDHKTVADLINRLNSGGNITEHLAAWAAYNRTPAMAAYADETRAANKAALDARKAVLKAQIADLEA